MFPLFRKRPPPSVVRVLGALAALALFNAPHRVQAAPAATVYTASESSLNQHALPAWYTAARFGIFVHWGPYSVPAWAPTNHPTHDWTSDNYIKDNPYAEWYFNSMRVPGSPTQVYHDKTYGPHYDYYEFSKTFVETAHHANLDKLADVIVASGARYVVLTTKHHDGFTLWPSKTQNPNAAPRILQGPRDLVGDLTTEIRKRGLRMGLYYSGGYDWTFNLGPALAGRDYNAMKPQTTAYGAYVDAQYEELIQRYHPSILWNDIDYPKSGHPMTIIADYYNTVPDGVVDDRYGIKHHDFATPEYQDPGKTLNGPWELTRGVGPSFGYNRNETARDMLSGPKAIRLLCDVVSRNGNLLLDIGPGENGDVSALQATTLRQIGAWMRLNGRAIYATKPFVRSKEPDHGDGANIVFTRNHDAIYAIILKQSDTTVTFDKAGIPDGWQPALLSTGQALPSKSVDGHIEVTLPQTSERSPVQVMRFSAAKPLGEGHFTPANRQ